MNPADYVGRCFIIGMHESPAKFRVLEVLSTHQDSAGVDMMMVLYHDKGNTKEMKADRIHFLVNPISRRPGAVFFQEITREEVPQALIDVQSDKFRVR